MGKIENRAESNKRRQGGEQGWRSGESTRVPPMWPGFKSRRRRHMWVEFLLVVYFAPRGFSPVTPVFTSPQKPTFPISNSTRNQIDELELLCGCAASKSFLLIVDTQGYDHLFREVSLGIIYEQKAKN